LRLTGDKFSVAPPQIGTVFLVGGLVTMVVQATLVQRLVKRFGEKYMTIASLLGMGFGFVLAALLPTFWMLYPTSLFRNGLGGFFWATMGAMTAARVQPREQGQLQGVSAALQNLMAVFGPIAAGVAYDNIAPATPLLIGALILAIGAALTYTIRQLPKGAGVSGAPMH
jgi:MFS family permease